MRKSRSALPRSRRCYSWHLLNFPLSPIPSSTPVPGWSQPQHLSSKNVSLKRIKWQIQLHPALWGASSRAWPLHWQLLFWHLRLYWSSRQCKPRNSTKFQIQISFLIFQTALLESLLSGNNWKCVHFWKWWRFGRIRGSYFSTICLIKSTRGHILCNSRPYNTVG